MSAAATTPTPTTLPERAFSLHCQGLRSPDIAQALGVPQRTIRYWIARVRDELVAAETAELRDEFLRAVEHFHQLSAAAWAAFEAEQAQASPRSSDAPDAPDVPAAPVGASGGRPPVAPSTTPNHTAVPRHSPRYLRLALDAQRQVCRLLGHYDHPSLFLTPMLDSSLSVEHALDPETQIPAKTAMPHAAHPEIPAKTATTAAQQPAIPAKTATAPTGLAAGLQPANPAAPHPSPSAATPRVLPAKTAPSIAVQTAIPAESATASVPQTRIPAESATRATLDPAFPAKTATSSFSSVDLRFLRSLRVEPRLSPKPAFPDSVPLHWRM